jgi:hypothetical protein
MNDQKLFSYAIYEEQTHLAELELFSFVMAVTAALGPAQAWAATEDWLDEADTVDGPPISISRDWRSVTIAASARLSIEIDALSAEARLRY